MRGRLHLIAFFVFVGAFGRLYASEASLLKKSNCTEYEWACKDGTCIDAVRRCDDFNDCSEAEDEIDCKSYYCDTSTHYLCSSGQCIGRGLVCDGNVDCHEGDDELHCFLDVCPKHMFRCKNGRCIPRSWTCDGNADCSEGTDEYKCPIEKRCADGYAQCNSTAECIPLAFFCDGVEDCNNGEDEEQCVSDGKCMVEHGRYFCKDKTKCIKKEAVCNGIGQCNDRSDEGGSCGLYCESKKPPCSQGCFRTPDGPKCFCQTGSKLLSDNITCQDLNECEGEIQVCDHFCENTEKSFLCSCADGYLLLQDKATCRIKDSSEKALMLFSVGNSIEAKYLGNSDSLVVWEGDEETSGVAFDPVSKTVYWISNGARVLFKSLYGQEEPKVFIHQGLLKPENLAIDWLGRNAYVADYEKKHILVCNLDNESCKPVLRNISQPGALQADLENKHLYWTSPTSRTIERAGLDGSKKRTFISDQVVHPNGLAIDHPASRIFWIDSHLDQVDSCDLSGKYRRILPNKDAGHAYSLAVWEDRIYWTDWKEDKKREIHSCRKRDAKAWKAEYKSEKVASNIMIYHPSMFKDVKNPCWSSLQMTCSHLCLLSPEPQGYKCDCPEEMSLSPNGHTCLEKGHKIPFVAVKYKLYRVPLRHYGISNPTLSKSARLDLGAVADMDYNPLRDQVYIADSKKGQIVVVNVTDRSTQQLIENVQEPISVAVDWLRDNLYWVNGYSHNIEVARSSGHFKKVIVDHINQPSDLSLDLKNGLLFVSDVSSKSIYKCELNGINCSAIVSKDVYKPTSVFVDSSVQPSVVYWTDFEKNTIESVDIYGNNRKKVFVHLKRPVKIYVDKEYILWTEIRSTLLHVASKNSQETKFAINIERETVPSDEWAMAVTMIDPRHDQLLDPCNNNTKCHQLCFSKTEKDKTCGCAEGLRLEQDESTCTPKKCESNQVPCQNDQCIFKRFWCDRRPDCEDESDEKNCSHTCKENEFTCRSGRCIPLEYKCDGVKDCEDDSDEHESLKCPVNNCKEDIEWKCDNGECIPSSWKCNPVGNCSDNSDEVDCNSHKCPANQMRCINGQCIPARWWCDDTPDCIDGGDEKDCPCKLHEYRCSDGSCLEKSKLCSREVSCGGEPLNFTCDPTHLRSRFEHVCAVDHIPCDENETPNQCVYYGAWCNGSVECTNGEDERKCENTICEEGYIKCRANNICIKTSWVCDTMADCPDKSDEANCLPEHSFLTTTQRPKCSSEEFECADGACIPSSAVCNDFSDCLNSEDEGDGCDECAVNNGGCQHECHNRPLRSFCSCNAGYTLSSWDGASCVDIDECAENEEICHHICKNLKGRYACECKEGYSLGIDGVVCKLKGESSSVMAVTNEVLYLTEDLKEQWEDPKGRSGEHNSLPDFSPHLSSFIYDPVNESLLIVDGENGILYREKPTSRWDKIPLSMDNVMATALDYINRNLYVTQVNVYEGATHNGVSRSIIVSSVVKIYNLENNRFGVLLTEPNTMISAMEISLALNEMFTCENIDAKENLVSRNLNGDNKLILVGEKVLNCESLAFDDARNRVYWFDKKLHRIDSIDFLGYNRKTFFSKEMHGVKGFSIIDRNLIWYNTGTQMLVKCQIRDSNCTESYYKSPLFLVNYKPVYDMQIKTPCKYSSCTQLCVPLSAHVPHCACIDGYEMKEKLCLPRHRTSLSEEGTSLSEETKGNCSDLPCNTGTCDQKPNGYFVCRCPEGYGGRFCEVTSEKTGENHNNLVIGFIVFFLVTAVLLGLFLCYKGKPGKLWQTDSSPYSRCRFVRPSSVLVRDEETPLPTTPPLPRRRSISQTSNERLQFRHPDPIVIHPSNC